MKRIPLFFIMLLICSHAYSASDFDEICSFFNELNSHPLVETLTPVQRYIFINEKVENLPSASYARITWEALASTTNERYALFQQAAVEVTGTSWQCSSMQELSMMVNSPGKENVIYDAPPGAVKSPDAIWVK